MLDFAVDFLKQNGRLVLATSSENQPYCSLMSYVTDDSGRYVYLLTGKDTRKSRNIDDNPNVSLLIDNRGQAEENSEVNALTVVGQAHKLTDENKKSGLVNKFFERHSELRNLGDATALDVICVEVMAFLLLKGVSDSYYMTVK